MLLKCTFSNFRSIRTAQELSFVATRLRDHNKYTIPWSRTDFGVLPVVALYGPNAAGKTNFIRALEFLCRAVIESHAHWSPEQPIRNEPFLWSAGTKHANSTFQVLIGVNERTYEYGIEVNSREIIREWLDAFPSGKRQLWFRRNREEFKFGKSLSGPNKTIQGLTRSNSLFLSAAAQNNHEQLLPIYRWFTDVRFVRSNRSYWSSMLAHNLVDNTETSSAVATILRAADLGVEGVDVEEVQLPRRVAEGLVAGSPSNEVRLPNKVLRVFLTHRTEEGSGRLPIEDESNGTQSLFALIGAVLGQRGGLVCIDEIDASLHTQLAKMFISSCQDNARESSGQLLFNTHDTNLLDPAILRRDQVWFAEKDNTGATCVYPLTDFKPRKGENLASGYLQGRFGAIPIFNESVFRGLGKDGE
jgi:uncharacterized protein